MDTIPGAAVLQVTTNAGSSLPVTVSVGAVSPGIFLSQGNHAAAQNQNGGSNTESNGAAPGSTLTVYVTGIGPTDTFVGSGVAAPLDSMVNATSNVTATIGGAPATVVFAGLTPGTVGMGQVNLVVPSLAPGDYPVVIAVGGVASNAPRITVQ